MSCVQGIARFIADGRPVSPQACRDCGARCPGRISVTGHVENVAEPGHRGASVRDCSCHDTGALVTSEYADRLVFQKRTPEEPLPLGLSNPGRFPRAKLLLGSQGRPSLGRGETNL